jgi:hypothetical protein
MYFAVVASAAVEHEWMCSDADGRGDLSTSHREIGCLAVMDGGRGASIGPSGAFAGDSATTARTG